MAMTTEKKYLNIPVPMLKDLYTDSKKFFNDVFDVGIYLYAQTLNGTEEKRYLDALKYLDITQKNITRGIVNAKKILNSMPEKYPIVGIEKDMLFDYYLNEKNEFEIICLGVFLAVKSILGRKVYCKTNKAFIHARMFGYLTAKDLPDKELLTSLQKKYQIRWHMDKVLLELQLNWHLKTLWNHNRGFYVSFDLTHDELAVIIEKDKQQTKIQQINEMKQKAIEKARILTTH